MLSNRHLMRSEVVQNRDVKKLAKSTSIWYPEACNNSERHFLRSPDKTGRESGRVLFQSLFLIRFRSLVWRFTTRIYVWNTFGKGDVLLVETRFKLTRLVRTQTSEIYLMWEGEKRIGQADIHFAHDTIHATVIFESDLTVSEEEELLAQIDEDIVTSYLPRFDREDFVAHVFRGEEISRYTDSNGTLDELDDDEDREE